MPGCRRGGHADLYGGGVMTPALSIRQPWAAALLAGLKPVENRTRPLPPKYINKPLLLHAGRAQPRPGEWSGLLFERAMRCGPLLYGGVIGVITFAPSVRDHPSEWTEPGCWHWPVVSVRAVEFWECRGMLGIFEVENSKEDCHAYRRRGRGPLAPQARVGVPSRQCSGGRPRAGFTTPAVP